MKIVAIVLGLTFLVACGDKATPDAASAKPSAAASAKPAATSTATASATASAKESGGGW